MIDPSNSKILVLGGTGFVGKAVCRLLQERGISYSKTSRSLGVDLRGWDETKHLFFETKPEAVINCAAYIGGVQFGYEHPAEIFSNNLSCSFY